MKTNTHTRIANVDFELRLPVGVHTATYCNSLVNFTAPQLNGSDVVNVAVIITERPGLDTWQPLVSEGPSWSILSKGDQRGLYLGDSIGMTASWSEDGSQAQVYVPPERLKWERDRAEITNPIGYPTDQLVLMYYLAGRAGLIVHAAGIIVEGYSLIFPGISGAGKSTLTNQLQQEGWTDLLSDDRIIVRRQDGHWRVYGTPWPGDAGVAVNEDAPLAAILFPARSETTSITPLIPQEALQRLLPASSILWHEDDLLTSQLATTEKLLGEIPAFELAWSPKTSILDHIQEFIRQLSWT